MALFKIRSSARDKQTDQQRVSAVLREINAAIASAEKERTALERRVKDAQDFAALAVGNDSDEYLSRDPKDTLMIVGHEQQVLAGRRRIEELRAHIDGLNAIRATCVARFPS